MIEQRSNLIRCLVVCILALPALAGDPSETYPGLNLIPWPKAINVRDGFLKVDGRTRIVAISGELKPLATILSQELTLLTGRKINVASAPARDGDIVLRINKAIKAGEQILVVRGTDVVRTTDGAHTIIIGEQAVVEGFDYRAVAEGTATLLGALSQKDGNFRLPRLSIKDWPHADYCGQLVDVARQNHPVDMLKKMVQVCRIYKVRYLHLHMTDDQGWTFPSTKYPQLGSKNEVVGHAGPGGVAPKVYDLQDLKALVAYADARGVTLVPELEMPGHAGAAERSIPEVFSAVDPATGRMVALGCMNIANDKLYEALDTIIGEMCDVFKSSPYFHIGSDEVSSAGVSRYSGYKAFLAKHDVELKKAGGLDNYFIQQVAQMVKKRGKKTIKWEGLADGASKDIVIMTWKHNSNQAANYIRQGYTTITCPWGLGVPWEKWSMYICNSSRLKKGDSVLGATLVSWEQSAAFHLKSGVRGVAWRQERTWGPDNTPTTKGFTVRWQALDAMIDKLMPVKVSAKGVNVPAQGVSVGIFFDTLTITLKSPTARGTIRYTLDGTVPTADSPAYSRPIERKEFTTLKAALFDTDNNMLGHATEGSWRHVIYEKNLATGKPVTTSGGTETWEIPMVPEFAVDGRMDTAWWAGPWPKWLKVDLQKSYKLNRIHFFPFWRRDRYYQYTFELSTDGKKWKQVVDASGNEKPETPAGRDYRFPATDARYVRVNMLKNSANEAVHIKEIRVYEAKDPADEFPGLNLIPWPKAINVRDGFLKVDGRTRIVATSDELKPLAKILSQELTLLTGRKINVASAPARDGDIVLRINKSIKAGEQILVVRGTDVVRTTDGAHTIVIGEQAVVEGFDYRAVAEGSSTLLGALSQKDGNFRLPRLSIKDWPHADYCGELVDVARQNHPIEMLKKMIQVCRVYKVRYLHLHMTDDQGWTFPSTKYPQLGSKNRVVGHAGRGGVAPKVYDLQELKGLVAYADARGIAIVPELEMPGHSGAARRSFPEAFDAVNPVSGRMVDLACMNIANDKLYEVLDIVIGEMCEVFKSSPYFHIGSDEVSTARVQLYSGYKAFLAKHNLKEHDLDNYFIRQVEKMINKRGKKTIKWEGLADGASKDIIIMTWNHNSNQAANYIRQGYTTITCPWGLGVPWEEWNMYICNGSRLKKGDSVLGATLVSWEQSADFHLAHGVRAVATRQERTWGPDNTPTTAGFAVRWRAMDAMIDKLLQMPPKAKLAATFKTPAGHAGFQEPVFALDGKDHTFYLASGKLKAGQSFTITPEKPQLVYAIEVLSGMNKRGLFAGELQVASDGPFRTVATFDGGQAKVVLPDNRVKAIRLLAKADQVDPLALREVKLQMLTELKGSVRNPAGQIGAGNVGVLTGDATFGPGAGGFVLPVLNKGFVLRFSGGSMRYYNYGGVLSGTGRVEFYMHPKSSYLRDSAITLYGKAPNTLRGSYYVKRGRVSLQKADGVDALAGKIIVGGQGDNDCLFWARSNQINDAATVELLDSPHGGARLILNGFSEKFESLKMASNTKVLTDNPYGVGGALTVSKLTVAGKSIPRGVYTSAESWIDGNGFVAVGDVKNVEIAGDVKTPVAKIGSGNIAVLKGHARLVLDVDFDIPVRTVAFQLILDATGPKAVRCTGFISGRGSLVVQTGEGGLELGGKAPNSYKGSTWLNQGTLRLNKAGGAMAIPGNLTVGGSKPENKGAVVIWGGDGQVSQKCNITLAGTQAAFLDLAGHKVALNKLVLSKAGVIRTGDGGALEAKQIHVDGKRLADGTYKAPQPWLEGTGTATVDARVDVGPPHGTSLGSVVGTGNIANLTGDAGFGYPGSHCDAYIITNGHNVIFDSGNGNALCVAGSISGTGNVLFYMGPSHTGFKHAPLRIAGARPNTTTGKFFVKKGRVQLEKPDGVDAISGDVIVGGQGFNDCLYWKRSNQIKDTVNITMLDTANSGAAYLNLNGCSEAVQSLTMTANNTVQTDGTDGKGGVLTVKSLTIAGTKKPAGTYTADKHKWIEGTGKVIVRP